jgi:hypothetical protein
LWMLSVRRDTRISSNWAKHVYQTRPLRFSLPYWNLCLWVSGKSMFITLSILQTILFLCQAYRCEIFNWTNELNAVLTTVQTLYYKNIDRKGYTFRSVTDHHQAWLQDWQDCSV